MKGQSLSVTVLTASLLLASSSVFADTKFRPRVDVGLAAYNLEIIVPGTKIADTTSNYLKAGIGASIITGRWYFDLGYSTSINAEADTDVETSDFSRKDLALTAGYVFQNNVTVFGGYKTGTSEFSNYVDKASGIADPTYTDEFTADGIYGGAGINFPSGGNVFSLNAALALLDGEYSDNSGDKITADATVGFSFGAGYSMPLSKTSGLAFKANYQAYDFSDYTFQGIALDGVSTNESILAFDVGYYATF